MDVQLPKNAVDPEQLAENNAPVEDTTPSKKRVGKRVGIVAGVIAAVLVVGIVGFLAVHDQPGFCNFACHTPMDPALETYAGVSGQPGVDKYGNVVDDAGDMLVVVHKEQDGAVCTTCHASVITQQINEGMHFVAGSYVYPLEERTLTELNAYDQNPTPEGFCLNEGCHDVTREELAIETADLERNPHVVEVNHPVFECSNCHKVHRQSVMYCSACHDDADVPEGWLSFDQAAAL